jgi:O-antigen/teichoic acid export membrane protein
MKPKFIANFLFLVFVNVLVKPFYVFGIDMKVQDTVGKEEYGLYAIIFSFSFIFFIVLDLGLTQYNSRVIAQDRTLLKSYLPNFILAKFILGFTFFTAIYIGALLLGYTSKELYWLGLLGAIHFLNSLTEYLRSNIAALHLFRLDAILSIINRTLLIVVCGVMLYGSYVANFRIEDFIYAQLTTLSFTALLSLGVVLKYAGGSTFTFDRKLIFSIIKESYPYALIILLTTIFTRVDFVMLKELLPETGKAEAGYYAAAYRFLDMSAMFGLLMASQLMPMFARLIKEKNELEIRNLVQTSFKLIMFVSIALSMGIAGFSEDIIATIFNESEYDPIYVGKILSLLILSFIPIASSYVFTTLLASNASLKALNIIGVIAVILNVIANYLLIPKYGALGAVYATLITQGIAALGHILIANRILDLRLSLSIFIKVILFGVLMYLLVRYGLVQLSVNWMMQFILTGILAVPIAWIMGLLDINMVKDIFNKKMTP